MAKTIHAAPETAPFASIGRNAPGIVVFEDREELVRYVVERSATLASLTALMPHLSDPGPGGPEFGFIAAFASLIQDHAYQLESATEILLGKEVQAADDALRGKGGAA